MTLLARVRENPSLESFEGPVGGDSNTVNVAGYTIDDEQAPFADRHGPSLRMIDVNEGYRRRRVHSAGKETRNFGGEELYITSSLLQVAP